MHFRETNLKGSFYIEQEKREDSRGFFARSFCSSEFKTFNLNTSWVQINNSLTKDIGTLRGLHFQIEPHQEVKLVRCIRGAIYDVIVDLRKDSLTFGKYFGIELNEDNRIMIYVPKGFAHGFITLKKNSEIFYLVSQFYHPESERTLKYDDLDVSINWPLKPNLISDKDKKGLRLKELNTFKI